MKNIIAFCFLMFGFFGFIMAETEPANDSDNTQTESLTGNLTKPNLLSRIHIGGNLSGGISNDYYFLTVAPRLSFELTKWFVPGVSITYMYSQENTQYKVTSNTWGAGVFADIYPIKFVYGHVEYQHLWYKQKVKGYQTPYSGNDNFLLLGAGVRVPIGTRAAMFASILFNVLNDENSDYYMYQNPIYSVGIDVSL